VTALSTAGQAIWQVLPLHPTHGDYHHSPYHAKSLFALNPLLISPELMLQEGIIDHHQIAGLPESECSGSVILNGALLKEEFLRAAARQNNCGRDDPGFELFMTRNRNWLEDYALFSAIARTRGTDWSVWPEGIREHRPTVLEMQHRKLAPAIEEEKYIQYLAFSQWDVLHKYAQDLGVRIFGDLPLYPAYGSADVWSHQNLFRLDDKGRSSAVAGVPPDYFSKTGQLWGNPVYNWEEIERQDFSWWVDRVGHLIRICDCLRVDHFRGLQASWEIPSGATTAREGRWVEAYPAGSLSLPGRFPRSLWLPRILERLHWMSRSDDRIWNWACGFCTGLMVIRKILILRQYRRRRSTLYRYP
jgi:4-alpha-glucanotransferase